MPDQAPARERMRCDIKAINGYRRCLLVMIHDARRVLGEARERLEACRGAARRGAARPGAARQGKGTDHSL